MFRFVENLEPRQLLSASKVPVTATQVQIEARMIETSARDFSRTVRELLAIARGESRAIGHDLNTLHSRPDELLFVGIRNQVNDEIRLVQRSSNQWLATERSAVADAKALDLRLIRHPGDPVLISRLQTRLANFDSDGPDVVVDDNDLDDSDDVDRAINDFLGIFDQAPSANPGNSRISLDIASGTSATSAAGTNVNSASQQLQSAFDTFNTDSRVLSE